MKAKALKEMLQDVDDNMDVYIRNSYNPFGNIQELHEVEPSSMSFFGIETPCLILNTESAKEMEIERRLK